MSNLLLPIGAFVMQLGWLRIMGINPNVLLVLLIIVARHTKNIWGYWIAVAISIALLETTPGFEWESLCIIVIACTSILWSRYAPFHPLLGTMVLIILVTIGWHAVFIGDLIMQKPMIVIGEIIYNTLLGVIIYGVMEMRYGART